MIYRCVLYLCFYTAASSSFWQHRPLFFSCGIAYGFSAIKPRATTPQRQRAMVTFNRPFIIACRTVSLFELYSPSWRTRDTTLNVAYHAECSIPRNFNNNNNNNEYVRFSKSLRKDITISPSECELLRLKKYYLQSLLVDRYPEYFVRTSTTLKYIFLFRRINSPGYVHG